MADQLSKSELEQCAHALGTSACVNLRKSSRAITRWFDEELEPAGLRSTQLAILLTVAVMDRPTYSHVARELVTDRSTLSRNLVLLQKEGLVKTRLGRSAKHKLVSLTPEGIRRVRETIPLWAATQQAFLSQFGADRWTEFLIGLAATVSSVHAATNSVE